MEVNNEYQAEWVTWNVLEWISFNVMVLREIIKYAGFIFDELKYF